MSLINTGAQTNRKTELVLLRFLTNSPYLTVGSKKYFGDQLVGKRNGVVYEFVVRDAGKVYNKLAHTNDGSTTGTVLAKNTIQEKKVQMVLDPWHIMVSTDAIEPVTDLLWEDEVAKPQGAKLAQGVIRKIVNQNFPKAASAIIGEGFQPLAEAGAALEEISDEEVYGFIDSKFEAILTQNGQQFQPVGSPNDFYSKGRLGKFQEVQYHSQRFMPKLKVSAANKTTLEGATAVTFAWVPTSGNTPGYHTLTLTGASVAIKAGTPISIEDKDGNPILFACDLIGDVTNNPFYFIAAEDAAAGAAIKLANVPWDSYTESGTRVFAKEDGEGFADIAAVNTFINAAITAAQQGDPKGKVTTPLEGGKTYFCGQLRLNGAMEFETLNKLDASNAETKVGQVNGFTMFENRVVDLDLMTNDTRWDVVTLSGITDPRAVINVYAKANH